MTAGSYPDDGLGEVFLKLGKQGSTLAGVMDAFSIATSIALQYGVPLEAFVSKFVNMRFEPSGMTDDPDIRMAQSIVDYIFRRLALDYLRLRQPRGPGHLHRRRAGGAGRGHLRRRPAGDRRRGPGPVGPGRRAPRRDRGASSTARQRQGGGQVAAADVHSSAELLEAINGKASDAPLCFTCGTKMRPAGSCYVCEGCGNTSGCS